MNLAKWKELLTNRDWRLRLVFIAGLAGMVLILLSQLFSNRQEQRPDGEVESSTAVFTSEEYIAGMEEKLTELIATIDGVGESRVMVTLESGMEYVYATEEKRNTDRSQEILGEAEEVGKVVSKENVEQSYIMVETSDGRKEPLLTTQIQPKIQGVVIVCEGADNIRVEQNLINVVTTALNIPSTRVCVVKISQQDIRRMQDEHDNW